MLNQYGRKNLTGKKLTISIGEPWDFISSEGKNHLNAEIISISNEEEKEFWMLCDVTPFFIENIKISQVIVIERYFSESIMESLFKSNYAVCNFVYSKNGELIYTSDDVKKLLSNNKYGFLVGGISLENSFPI